MAPKILIVCLGNICRSPIGEAVLRHVAAERGLEIEVDSAGTGDYHVGEWPDDRAAAVCKKFNVPMKHEARQVQREDFYEFTHLLAADENNLRNLNYVKPKDATAEIRLWGSYLDGKPISDPYYGNAASGFEQTFHQCVRLSKAFLDSLESKPSSSNL
ncbi:phosphotyrosine protein phosphatase [Vararia minispora EC-137]|uniref:Phosphotyrosine protein phosphatase n=1 Tax=Vararia minispora EC-137 TaxID=1314806 RepID=A0ACB8QYA6_9AGAM|nr:phosphotyrosine protein phosphatase [Vararia minispora EC-137]